VGFMQNNSEETPDLENQVIISEAETGGPIRFDLKKLSEYLGISVDETRGLLDGNWVRPVGYEEDEPYYSREGALILKTKLYERKISELSQRVSELEGVRQQNTQLTSACYRFKRLYEEEEAKVIDLRKQLKKLGEKNTKLGGNFNLEALKTAAQNMFSDPDASATIVRLIEEHKPDNNPLKGSIGYYLAQAASKAGINPSSYVTWMRIYQEHPAQNPDLGEKLTTFADVLKRI